MSQDLAETRRTASLYTAPSCTWSSTPPAELDNATAESLSVNAGFFTFGNTLIFWGSVFLTLYWFYIIS